MEEDYVKNFFAQFKAYFIGCLKFIWEIILFIINLPIYIKRFLEGLRTFSKSYDEIIKSSREGKEELTRKANGNMSDEIFAKFANKIIELKNEQEKMFNQLFGIFVATLALIISICALIINLTKK